MEPSALGSARAGDEGSFRALVDPHRRELQLHCYRMMGSLTDAEDMLQETLLAAWRGLAGYQERASLRTWLYRIATNQCLNALRAARRRIPAEPTPPFRPPDPTRRGEVTWLQPYPDTLLEGIPAAGPGPEARYQTMEAVELAFIAALQRMPPRQAAALVLCDVLGFRIGAAAGMLGTGPTAVKGALQRARAAVDGDVRRADRAHPGSPRERDLARRFADAFVSADINGVVALLTDEAWLSMPPAPHEYHGADAIRSFLRASFGHRGERRARLVPVRANTQPAFGSYVSEPTSALATPAGLIVLTVSGVGIRGITRFHLNGLFPRFGLPGTWAEHSPAPRAGGEG